MLATIAAASMLSVAAPSQAATVLSLGAACETTCFSAAQHTFQRTWSASELSGVGAISALSLDRSLLGEMQNYAVRVTFQDAAGNTVADWGAFTVSVLTGEVVTLGSYEALAWDASRGDLTLKLEVMAPGARGVGGVGGGGGGGFAAPGPFSSPGGLFGGSRVTAPVPSAQSILPSAVALPEPSAWALMLTGFLGAGAMLRRRALPLPKVG